MRKTITTSLYLLALLVPVAYAQEDEVLPAFATDALQNGKDVESAWKEMLLEEGKLGSKTNPVLCHQPSGEREYLDRLRCSNGEAPGYERIGSFGEGPDGHIIDGYDVNCPDHRATVFLDMYHEEHVETAPAGKFKMALPE